MDAKPLEVVSIGVAGTTFTEGEWRIVENIKLLRGLSLSKVFKVFSITPATSVMVVTQVEGGGLTPVVMDSSKLTSNEQINLFKAALSSRVATIRELNSFEVPDQVRNLKQRNKTIEEIREDLNNWRHELRDSAGKYEPGSHGKVHFIARLFQTDEFLRYLDGDVSQPPVFPEGMFLGSDVYAKSLRANAPSLTIEQMVTWLKQRCDEWSAGLHVPQCGGEAQRKMADEIWTIYLMLSDAVAEASKKSQARQMLPADVVVQIEKRIKELEEEAVKMNFRQDLHRDVVRESVANIRGRIDTYKELLDMRFNYARDNLKSASSKMESAYGVQSSEISIPVRPVRIDTADSGDISITLNTSSNPGEVNVAQMIAQTYLKKWIEEVEARVAGLNARGSIGEGVELGVTKKLMQELRAILGLPIAN